MPKICDIFEYIEKLAPSENRCEWDNDGLQVCEDETTEVDKVLLCLDVTDSAIDTAVKAGIKLIISHHPLIFSPLKSVENSVPEARLAIKLLKHGISLISAHTRLDKAAEGVNETLANLMGLSFAKRFGEDDIGIIGSIHETDCKSLALFAKKTLGTPSVSYVLADKPITRLALVCGSGKDFLYDAFREGADALLTGDVSYTAFMTAQRLGIALIDAGHFYTEFPILEVLRQKLGLMFPNLQIMIHKEAITEEI